LFFQGGKGPYLWDLAGKKYIDYRAALGPIILGYCDPAVDAAAGRQIRRGIIFSMPGDREFELAELVCKVVPCAEMVRFLKTGGEAVNAAIRVARAYTGRSMILSQGYHGSHDQFFGADQASCGGILPSLKRYIRVFPYGELDTVGKYMKHHGERVAAIIVNAFDGSQLPPAGYLTGLRNVADKYGSLLIFDEVKTGFRLALGGAQERYKVVPHLGVFAKAMANGYPLAALAGERKVMSLLAGITTPLTAVTNTLAGELMSIAAAIATINRLRAPNVYTELYRNGQALMTGIRRLFVKHGLDGKVVGEPTFFKSWISGSGRGKIPLQTVFIRDLMRHGVFGEGEWLVTISHCKAVIKDTLDRVDDVLCELKRR
jgi:glutamate-1-semialdehyde aminotransferase